MLQRVVEYYKRYKRPILVAGGAVTLTYLAAYYAKQKFIQFQDRAAKARAAKENLRRRFELNQVDAMDTILDLVKGLKEQFQLKLNHEELVSRITNLKPKKLSNPEVTDTRRGLVSPVETKLQLWEKLKILTFTEVLGSLYVIELLGMLIYIQMNLVGRLIYIESVVEEHSAVGAMKDANNSSTPLKASLDLTSSAAELSHEDKRAYFSFSWWFINRGWKSILEIIQSVVVQVVGSIPLKHRFTYNELVILFASLRAEIDHKLFSNPEFTLNFLFPPDFEGECEVLHAIGALGKGATPEKVPISSGLRMLLDETKDFIECPDFELVRSKAMTAMVEFMLIDLKENLSAQANDLSNPIESSSGLVDISRSEGAPSLPLAKLLSILAKLANSVFRSDPNPYLRVFAQCREMQAFAAIVYSSFEILN